MAADASAFAVLGLEPGADMAAIERAYKRLIKEHHPDREGGNARTAAEINRAYRELRAADAARHGLDLEHREVARRSWSRVALFAAIAILVLVAGAGPVANLVKSAGRASGANTEGVARSGRGMPDVMDGPLSSGAIKASVGSAVSLARHSDQMAMARVSRDCHHAMRSQPTLAQLDRCAAFDDAVVQLQDRDPLRDSGPFSELAVTGRLMGAASLLSSDYLAIDGRLDRIRLEVELALAPEDPTPPQPIGNSA